MFAKLLRYKGITKSIFEAKQSHFNIHQFRQLHLSSSYRDKKKDDKPVSAIDTDLEEFSETMRQTLVPLRTTEKRLSHSYYDTVEFYGSPRHKTVILFPGDAYLGMSKRCYEVPTVRDMYDAASQYLGVDMHQLSSKGPIRDLSTQTFQQPAVFLASLAASEKLRHENPYVVENCVATAGFSIGELTAMVFAGALSFEDGLRLSMLRGEAMHVASEQIEGGLMTIIHEESAELQLACQYAIEVCNELLVKVLACDIAHFISPEYKVIGGNGLALRYLKHNAEEFGITRTEHIQPVGAFHTPLMKIAVQPFSKYVVNTDFEDPLIPVFSNETGDIYDSGEDIRHSFGESICKPIRWDLTLHNIYNHYNDDISETYICGPSKFLKRSLQLNYRCPKDSHEVEI